MKKTVLLLSYVLIILLHSYAEPYSTLKRDTLKNLEARENKFIISFITMATRYSTGKDYYRPFLSGFLTPANEIQMGYQINSKWSIATGVNYQVIAIHSTKYERAINDEVPRKSAYIKQFSFPVFISFTIRDKEKLYQQIVAGLYWGQTFNDHYIIEKYYPREGGWLEAGTYNTFNSSNTFYNIYSGVNINYRITRQFKFNIEPFISYQLQNNNIIENVYNRLFFGIKTGLSYNFLNMKK
jgi:hypothetical protein